MAVFSLISATVHNVKLETKSFLDDKISMKIPTDFTIMSEEIKSKKYPAELGQSLIYTNEDFDINVLIKYTEYPAKQGLLLNYKEQLTTQYKTLQPKAKWLNNEIVEINGRDVAYFEFITPTNNVDVHNFQYLTDVDGRLLMCSINFTIDHTEEWLPAAREIMNSLELM